MLEDILKKAEEHGITRKELGRKAFKSPDHIYILRNPRQKTLYKLEKALYELIEEKRKEKYKNVVDLCEKLYYDLIKLSN